MIYPIILLSTENDEEDNKFLRDYLQQEKSDSPKILEIDIQSCAYNEEDYIRTLQTYIDVWIDLDEKETVPLRRHKIEYTLTQINQLNQQKAERINRIEEQQIRYFNQLKQQSSSNEFGKSFGKFKVARAAFS